MRDLKKEIANYRAKRKSRMDERKARFDFEVGVFPPDETGDRKSHGGNTRLPYGLCKAAGINTEGMTPSDAWEALEGKTGIKPGEAYKKLEDDGDAKKLAKEAEKLSKKKKKKPVDEAEVPGSEEFEEKVEFSPDKELPALTPVTFKSTIIAMKPHTLSVGEFSKEIEDKIMPRVKKGQTVAAGGHTYYCNGEGFETESGEERTRAFVAYRLAKYAKEGKNLELSSTSSVKSSKEYEKESAKASAANQFKSAMSAAKTTVDSGSPNAAKKCATHIKLVMDELPIGAKIEFALTNDDGKVYKMTTVEKVGDDKFYFDGGGNHSSKHTAWELTESLQANIIPSLDADDLSLPSELMTTKGYKYEYKEVSGTKTPPSETHHSVVTPAMKSSLSKGSKITVKKTTPFNPKDTPTLKHDSKTRSIWRAIHSRLFKSSDIKAVESGVKRLMDENEFCMSRSGNMLKTLLETGFKNQIEVLEGEGTTDSISYANPDERRKASQRLFGTPMNTKADSYEKYGFLGNPWSYDGDYGSTYGDVTLVFDKNKLKDRTTYALGDSLGPSVNRGMVAGRVGDNPTFEGWYLSRPKAKALEMLKNGESLSEILSYTKNAYLELQFHGELTMSDVKCIVFKSSAAYKNYVTAEMQKAFDDLGIEVSIK